MPTSGFAKVTLSLVGIAATRIVKNQVSKKIPEFDPESFEVSHEAWQNNG